MTTLTKILAVAAALTCTAVTDARAQDFTQMDLTALNGQWNLNQNRLMNDQLQQMLWQIMNDPQVQAVYSQQVAQGLFYGSLAEFAYKWAYTGGMSQAGYGRAMGVNAQLDREFRGQMAGDAAGRQVYVDAWGRYVNQWGQIMDQNGNILMGQ